MFHRETRDELQRKLAEIAAEIASHPLNDSAVKEAQAVVDANGGEKEAASRELAERGLPGIQLPSTANDAPADPTNIDIPSVGSVSELVADGGSFAAQTSDGTVAISRNLALGVTVDAAEGTAELPLPTGSAHTSGELTDDGSVLYTDTIGEFDVKVIAGAEATQVQTIIQNPAAPSEYVYTFSDSTVLLEEGSGGIVAFDPEIESSPDVHIAAPWAFDANGSKVPTHYEIRDASLVQVVDHINADFAYPIVADPTYSLGLGTYAHFNRAETATIASMGWGATGATAVCGAAGALLGPGGAAAVAAACIVALAPVVYQAGLAQNSKPKKCLYIRIVTSVPTLVAWPGTYKDKRCK